MQKPDWPREVRSRQPDQILLHPELPFVLAQPDPFSAFLAGELALTDQEDRNHPDQCGLV